MILTFLVLIKTLKKINFLKYDSKDQNLCLKLLDGLNLMSIPTIGYFIKFGLLLKNHVFDRIRSMIFLGKQYAEFIYWIRVKAICLFNLFFL